jgi:hypothetical protein
MTGTLCALPICLLAVTGCGAAPAAADAPEAIDSGVRDGPGSDESRPPDVVAAAPSPCAAPADGAMVTSARKAEIQQQLYAELQRANPGYAGKADIVVDQSGLVTSVSLADGASAIVDLSPLRCLPLRFLRLVGTRVTSVEPVRAARLESVDFQSNTLLTDISALQDMPLTAVTFYACRSLADITALKHARLTKINFEGTKIKDLSALRGQPIVEARICSPVVDLSPVEGMPLRHIDVGGGTGNDRNLSDLSPLHAARDMRDLRFDQTSVSDISVVKGMPALRFLAMFDTKVTDLSALAGLSLETIFITPKNFSAEQMRVLRAMTSLKAIDTSWRSWPNPQSAETFWRRYDAGEYR